MSTISSALPQTNTAATSTPKTPVPVVAKTNDSELAVTATNIAAEASVVSTLGGTTTGGFDAVSLLSFLERSTPTTSLPGTTTGATGTTPDSGSTVDTSGSAAGTVGDWAALLKQNPALAYTAATDNFNQAILSTLNIVA
jgi:hypothetical protein